MIRAERRDERPTKERGSSWSEFRYGSFERTIPLLPGANATDVSATYKDGILEVRVPIDDREAEAARIPVQRG